MRSLTLLPDQQTRVACLQREQSQQLEASRGQLWQEKESVGD
jgi:hypothetical protein